MRQLRILPFADLPWERDLYITQGAAGGACAMTVLGGDLTIPTATTTTYTCGLEVPNPHTVIIEGTGTLELLNA
jgi:hypothetical protein